MPLRLSTLIKKLGGEKKLWGGGGSQEISAWSLSLIVRCSFERLETCKWKHFGSWWGGRNNDNPQKRNPYGRKRIYTRFAFNSLYLITTSFPPSHHHLIVIRSQVASCTNDGIKYRRASECSLCLDFFLLSQVVGILYFHCVSWFFEFFTLRRLLALK